MIDDDSAMLHNRAMIINNLSMLAKQKCMISASLGGKETVLTFIVAINYKEGTLILDYGSSDYLNKKMLSTPNVKFNTSFIGIEVAFTSDRITLIKYEGEPAFSMPIPSSLYWYNRREYYRVKTPMTNPSACEIPLATPTEFSTKEYVAAYQNAIEAIKLQRIANIQKELVSKQEEYNKLSIENKIKAKLEQQKLEAERQAGLNVAEEARSLNLIDLDLHDIGLAGFSMTNYSKAFSFFLTLHSIHENCTLIMPGHDDVSVSFEIMTISKIQTRKAGEFAELVGVKFIELKPFIESTILLYIQDIERQSGILNIKI